MSEFLNRDYDTGDFRDLVAFSGGLLRYASCLMLVFSFVFPGVAAEKQLVKIQNAIAVNHDAVGLWQTDYRLAKSQAITTKKNMLIHFVGKSENLRHRRFITDTCFRPEVRPLLESFICVRLPYGYTVSVDGQKQTLLQLPEFEVMQRQGGLAVIDFSCPDSTTYGQVIGGLPFVEPSYYAAPFESATSVSTFLGLPSGGLAERMMVYAIRMHPEGPQSTTGVWSPVLRQAALSHSQRQAILGRQGHQQWQSRFQQLWKQIGGKPPVEVCAESWPGEPLVTACLGCVHAWRQSAGHWQLVFGSHPLYAYSIHRGRNRIWYATGIFGG
ncbi:MAG: hypothetical protein VXZ84_08570 [Planctomycetota bacterium]|nr:hypothetical protein [Planctomycetota bacterium]